MPRLTAVQADGNIPSPGTLSPPEGRYGDPDECPVCREEACNYEPHGCAGDCRRGCQDQSPAPCDKCATACADCGEENTEKASKGRCVDCSAEHDADAEAKYERDEINLTEEK